MGKKIVVGSYDSLMTVTRATAFASLLCGIAVLSSHFSPP